MSKTENREISIYINEGDLQTKLASYQERYAKLEKAILKLVPGTDAYIKKSLEIEKIGKLINQTVSQLDGRMGPTLKQLKEEARKLNAELDNMPIELRKTSEAAKRLEVVEQKIREVKAAATATTNALSKMKGAVDSFIGNLSADLFQKFLSAIQESFAASVRLSDQMADIRKTTGMTADEAERLRDQLTRIDTRTSMTALLDIAKVGGQFGVAKDQLYDFVKAVDVTAVALGDEFSGGAEQVATEMSKLRNIFADIKSDNIGDDIGFISNAINELASAGVATGPVVADLANRIGGYGIQIGLSSGETLGLAATLQELGVSAERGGTATIKILQKMLTSSKDFARIAGMDLKSFEDMLNHDLYGAFVKVMEGSKRLGPNAMELSSIISELEVEGAGASEVFAKLGANTDMLREKADLATGSLTNTESVMAEFAEKNDNLAGSVAMLNGEWNKLSANSSTEFFFKRIIDLTRAAVGGLKVLIDFLSVGAHMIEGLFTGNLHGGAEEAMRQRAERNAVFAEEVKQREHKVFAEHLAAYKQHLNSMTEADIAQEMQKKSRQAALTVAYMKQLQEEGRLSEFWQEMKWLKYQESELAAIRKIGDLKAKENEKIEHELSEKEKKALEKEQKKAQKEAERREKERLKEINRVWKLQVDAMDDLFRAAEQNANKDLKLLIDTNKKKWEALKEFHKKEIESQLDYDVLAAATAEQRKDAEISKIRETYRDKIATIKAENREETAQYKLLERKMNEEIEEVERKYAKEKRDNISREAMANARTEEEIHIAKIEQIKSKFEAEMELEKENAEAVKALRAEMNQQLAEEDSRHIQTVIGQYEEYARAALEIANTINDSITANEENNLRKEEKVADKKKDTLKQQYDYSQKLGDAEKEKAKDRLDKKLISEVQYQTRIKQIDAQALVNEEEYNKQVKKVDDDMDKQKAAQAKKAAKRRRNIAIFEIAINTAKAIMESIAESPMTYGLPWSAVNAVLGGVQLGAVLSEPAPEYFVGGFTPKTGNDRDAFPATVHANEYIIPASQLRDPSVANFTNMIEASRTGGKSVSDQVQGQRSQPAGGSATSVENNVALVDLAGAVNTLNSLLEKGIEARAMFDDERIYRLSEKQSEQKVRDNMVSW